MNRRTHKSGKWKTVWVGGMWLLSALTACEPLWNSPESRARDFIEALVMAPAQTQSLRDIGNLPPEQDPNATIDNLSARVGLDFLRARLSQGVTLKFVQGEIRRVDDMHHAVMIHVSYLQPGTLETGEVRFLVRIEKDDQGRWHIARVTGDN